MKFEPIEEILQVGCAYNLNFRDLVYCVELQKTENYFNFASLEKMIDFLRQNRVTPSQIDNIGTGKPFITKPLKERQFNKLKHLLYRSIVLVIKHPDRKVYSHKPSIFDAYTVDIAGVEIDCKLLEVPKILNTVGCRYEDFRIIEATQDGYGPRSDNYTLSYIVSQLENI